MKRHIRLNVDEAAKKPNTTLDRDKPCPFCDEDLLKRTNNVVCEEEDRRLIENKFPTFPEAYQTVFIESRHCDKNLSNYEKESLYAVLLFGFKQWTALSKDPSFQSVVFFKNHGVESSASIQHAHMQIVGLKEVDYRLTVEASDFEGLVIAEAAGVQWNLSTTPKNELYEFNVLVDKKEMEQSLVHKKTKAFKRFCENIQYTTHFLLTSLCAESQSFNVVFYEFNEKIVAKIIARNPNKGARLTPLFLGYRISMAPSDLEDIKETIKKKYLPLET